MELTEAAKQARSEYNRKYKANLSPEAKDAKNAYLREWRAKNKDKVLKHNADYWEKKVRPLDHAMFREAVSNEILYPGLNDHANEPD